MTSVIQPGLSYKKLVKTGPKEGSLVLAQQMLVKSFKEGHMLRADGQSRDLLPDWKKKKVFYVMRCRQSLPVLIFNRNVPFKVPGAIQV